MLSIQPRIFNISIDSSSLNIFSSLSLHLLQVIERTYIFFEKYDILGFPNFICLPQITQYISFIFLIIENVLVLFYHSFYNHLEKTN